MEKKKDVLRETDDEAIRLAKTLLRTSRYGAIAVMNPDTGAPVATRVAVASDHDGTPIILVSGLAAHTRGIEADPRCSLLLGETGKGDPLAHPRMTITSRAARVERDGPGYDRIRWRFLAHNPKSKLYVDLGDFSFFRLEIQTISLNGGFARAYALTPADALTQGPAIEAIAAAEPGAVAHMNDDHSDAVANYAIWFGKVTEAANWTMTGIDADGFDLAAGDRVMRIFFTQPLSDATDMHKRLVSMAIEARQGLAKTQQRVQ